MASKLPILEVFGPTIQGEGPAVGRKVMFIRTAGCDYGCSWCDSAFTWNGTGKEQIRMLSPQEIVSELVALDETFDYLVISGGNPALIKDPMEDLITLLQTRGVTVALETQGSRWQNWMTLLDDLVISPKPPSSKMVTDYAKLSEIVYKMVALNPSTRTSIKVVVFDEADYAYARELFLKYKDYRIPFYLSVGNTDVEEQGDIYHRVLADYNTLVNKVIADPEMQGISVLPQVHTLLYGNKKGV